MSTSALNAERRGTGRPLLLVHGLGSSWPSWNPILDDLARHREVIAIDLPGFGESAPLPGKVTLDKLTESVAGFISAEGLDGVDTVGSSMGARMVLELSRRGIGGDTVALDPGGFWTPGELRVFSVALKASIPLVLALQPAMPVLMGNPAGRTALLAQFSAAPWRLPAPVALHEMRSFAKSTRLKETLDALIDSGPQEGAPAGTTPGRVTIGWGRQDRVTFPSQATRAHEAFPGSELHWFDKCGHFPTWDQPKETVELILARTGG